MCQRTEEEVVCVKMAKPILGSVVMALYVHKE